MIKEKKKYNFFNVVVDKQLLTDIKELRNSGVNWQAITRNFLQAKTRELKKKESSVEK